MIAHHVEGDVYSSVIPSHFVEVLRSLVGKVIVRAVRYSWLPPSEAVESYSLSPSDVFSLTAGALALTFDSGLTIGIGSDPRRWSVVLWVERTESGDTTKAQPLSSDRDLHPVSATDQKFSNEFWRDLVGSTIGNISIITNVDGWPLRAGRPNEVGVYFGLTSGRDFVASHGLHDESDTFSVISNDKIAPQLRADRKYTPIA
jgi:hypothetical protein